MIQDRSDIKALLASLPLFDSFSPPELEELLDLFREETRLKGETICEFGDEAENFYVILRGELEVFIMEGAKRRIFNRMGPGDFFGELALVLNEKRTASVRVSRRAELLVIEKEPFNRFFLSHTKALEYLSRAICQRLASATSGQVKESMTKVVSVASRPEVKGKSLVAGSIASLLGGYSGKKALLISVGPEREGAVMVTPETSHSDLRSGLRELTPELTQLRIGIRSDSSRTTFSETFSKAVFHLGTDFPFQVFDLEAEPQALIDSVADFTDVLVSVEARLHAGLPEYPHLTCYRVLNRYNKGAQELDINHCEPFVLPRDPALAELDLVELAKTVRTGSPTPATIPLQRLARKILGRTIGVALGGGAAFGLAHLGVLKVLEENGIPIDILVGCSMGSLVGIGYSAGVSSERLIELADRLGTPAKLLKLAVTDATFARPGFMTGKGIGSTFKPYLGERKTFRDLLYPCQVVATDLENGERVAIGTGDLVKAFSASCSVPMILAPVKHEGRILVDGGVADPVPAEVVRDMGADICIAINVVPPIRKGVESGLAKAYKMFNQFNPLAYMTDTRDLPSIFDVVLKSLQTLQYELGNFKAISADVRINPDLSDFTWVDFGEDREIIARGVKAAEEALPTIHRVISAS